VPSIYYVIRGARRSGGARRTVQACAERRAIGIGLGIAAMAVLSTETVDAP
jgi:hypothetical protein